MRQDPISTTVPILPKYKAAQTAQRCDLRRKKDAILRRNGVLQYL
jgi:hypothetical protein